MKRVAVFALFPGMVLEEPLYGEDKKLLLAKGETLTEEMLESLNRAGTQHTIMGEWDEKDFFKFESATHISEYRKLAEKVSQFLQAELEKTIDSATDLNVSPVGTPLEEDINREPPKKRDEKHIREWEKTRNQGASMVEQIVEGHIDESQVAQSAMEAVDGLVRAFSADRCLLTNLVNLKTKTEYLYTHSVNMAILAINIAAALQYDEKQVSEIAVAAILHDIGMAMVPEDVVNAPRKLTPMEFIDIQKHPIHGLYSLDKMDGLPLTARFITYQCHERIDGSGYPKRRQGDRIHRFAQIVALADVYDAMTRDRPWRKAYHPYKAMEFLVREAGRGKYDPGLVRALLRYLSLFPIGSLVRLNTGQIAKVVSSNWDAFDRPTVSILFDQSGAPLNEPETIDLLNEDELRIETFVEDHFDIDSRIGF